MAPIEALQSYNPFLQTQGVDPFKVQAPKVGQPQGEPKVGGTQETGLQAELAYIRNNGMRVNDQTYAVNEPFATTTQRQLGRAGVSGGTLRYLS